MRYYCQMMLNAVQSSTAYRFHTFISTMHRLIGLTVQVSLWMALYKGADTMHVTITQASLQEMWMYSLYSSLIGLAIANGNIYTLSDRIQTGQIASDLIRPVGLFRSFLAQTIGSKAFVLLFEIIPVLLAASFLFGIQRPAMVDLLWFLAAFPISFMVYFLLTFLIGMTGFWYLRTFHLDFMLGHVMQFFSGMLVPLWFFPKPLLTFASWLPFDLVYYSPLSILLGKQDMGQIGWALAKGCAWIVLLAIASVVVWHLGKTKLVVQGG